MERAKIIRRTPIWPDDHRHGRATGRVSPTTIRSDSKPRRRARLKPWAFKAGPDPVTATAGGNSVLVNGSRLFADRSGRRKERRLLSYIPAQGNLPGEFDLLFSFDGPVSDVGESSYIGGVTSPDDPVYNGNTVPAGVPGDGSSHSGADALSYWVKTRWILARASISKAAPVTRDIPTAHRSTRHSRSGAWMWPSNRQERRRDHRHNQRHRAKRSPGCQSRGGRERPRCDPDGHRQTRATHLYPKRTLSRAATNTNNGGPRHRAQAAAHSTGGIEQPETEDTQTA